MVKECSSALKEYLTSNGVGEKDVLPNWIEDSITKLGLKLSDLQAADSKLELIVKKTFLVGLFRKFEEIA